MSIYDFRRNPRRSTELSEQLRSAKKFSPILLTQEEKKLIEELYFSELD
ncbi:MAG: hypothetical protein NTX38_03880 [Methylobacter sp.]|nr:hypothetical protein [Methylobacter sp.]